MTLRGDVTKQFRDARARLGEEAPDGSGGRLNRLGHAPPSEQPRAGVRTVTTIENEYPLYSYVEEAGGPAGLGALGEVVVWSGGYVADHLLDLLSRIAAEGGDAIILRHWGDADPDGLGIWWQIRSTLGRPVQLFRTTAEWVREVAKDSLPSQTTAPRYRRPPLNHSRWWQSLTFMRSRLIHSTEPPHFRSIGYGCLERRTRGLGRTGETHGGPTNET
ncbi:MAG: Wadjet anti-phage system protein JetD domain-containing protein [Gemmatimonadaceae bacterium]